jgi:hypothetical protein
MPVRIRSLLLFGLVTLCAAAPKLAQAKVAQATCVGGRSLVGYYGVLIGGNSLTPNMGGKYLSGAIRFDGKCGLTGTHMNGGINGSVSTTSVTGTYGQNADSTITVTFNLSDGSPAQTFLVGLSQSTKEAVGIETDGSATATIDLQPQRINTPAYTNASMVGTFAVVCSGLAAYKDDLNFVTFDGQGNLTGQNPFNVDGFIGSSPYAGTYTVFPDGTFQGVLLGSYSEYSFSGVIDNKLGEVEYTYAASGVGGIVACSGKK